MRYSPSVAFSPIDFIRSPMLWADVIEKFEGTMTAAPNFAYGLLARRMKQANRTFAQDTTLLCADMAAEP
eukprot:CAMPEP_0194048902 /NCGR_PEP_ID=MMETSP0009_2-20130614/28965_1 /TAXON_ID=210454 /ORGANISM="Grammatophora oceanica, Strain CCMP 410" /LENGTH=69 /DNA_ID=CAMNT_0038694927 /DNA_START=1 /DNA_END=206 /DNA_ORIENTATION=+